MRSSKRIDNMRLSNICLIIFLLGAIVFPSAYAANALVNNSASTSTNQKDLVSLVDKAAAYAQGNGKDMAIQAINKGKFVNGTLSVFAADFKGICLADPNPTVVSNDLSNLQDAKGTFYIKNMTAMAKSLPPGPGKGDFVYYYWTTPATHNIEQRAAYVEKIDSTWWIAGS